MTIKDLSAQTGYSVGTVSRVLNDQPNVSEKARKTIREAAAACGFQLNANAQQLKRQRSNNILVIVKGSSNQFFGTLVEAIQSRVSEKTSYHLVVDYLDEENNEVLRALQLVREKKPLGILFLGGNQENFQTHFSRIDTPCVLVTSDASDLTFPNLSSVCCDEFQATRSAIDQLISMGHRRIGIIGGYRERSDTAYHRFQGCMAAFEEHKIPFAPDQDYANARFSYEEGYLAAEKLIVAFGDFFETVDMYRLFSYKVIFKRLHGCCENSESERERFEVGSFLGVIFVQMSPGVWLLIYQPDS